MIVAVVVVYGHGKGALSPTDRIHHRLRRCGGFNYLVFWACEDASGCYFLLIFSCVEGWVYMKRTFRSFVYPSTMHVYWGDVGVKTLLVGSS